MNSSILHIENVSIGYPKKELIKGIDASMSTGEMTLLIGANGVGKSTLMKSILGLLPVFNGRIMIDGNDCQKLSEATIARLIAYIPSRFSFAQGLTVYDLIAFGRIPYLKMFRALSTADKRIIVNHSKNLGITDLLPLSFDQLSDGQQQKVRICKALVQETPIIVLDEPTTHLDISNKKMVFELLSDSTQKGKTILCITHDINTAFDYSDQIWLMDKANGFTTFPSQETSINNLLDYSQKTERFIKK